ncbi:hypothetical protein ACHAW5_001919 [Stephanodiscus triporus]|uniref:Transmembrane protein n=1 Tax=Stephanodiscus triporus TaxID=2934178 RepID=A0ABD3QV03_9STRA
MAGFVVVADDLYDINDENNVQASSMTTYRASDVGFGGGGGVSSSSFGYLSTQSLPVDRSSDYARASDRDRDTHPASFDGEGRRRRRRTTTTGGGEEEGEGKAYSTSPRRLLDVGGDNECSVVRGGMILTIASNDENFLDDETIAYMNLGGRVIDVLLRDSADGSGFGIVSSSSSSSNGYSGVVGLRVVDPRGGGTTAGHVSVSSAAAEVENFNVDASLSSSSFWLRERNGVPAGMAVLASMGCLLVVMVALFVGTSSSSSGAKKRRRGDRVLAIDDYDNDLARRTYREEDIEVEAGPTVEKEETKMTPSRRGGKKTRTMSPTPALAGGNAADSVPPPPLSDVDDDYSVGAVGNARSASASETGDRVKGENGRALSDTVPPSPIRGRVTPTRGETGGVTWMSVGRTPVVQQRGRRVVEESFRAGVVANVDGDDGVEVVVGGCPHPAGVPPLLDFFSGIIDWPRLVSPESSPCGGVELELNYDGNANNDCGSVDPGCANQAFPFFRRLFAPHVEVEASLSPFDRRWNSVPEVVTPAKEEGGGDGIERNDRPCTKAAGNDFIDAGIPPPLMSAESNDLALTPKHLSSVGNTLGRFLARGGRSSLDDRFTPRHQVVSDFDDQDGAVVGEIDIREIREVMSGITMQPCKSRNSPKTVHRYQSPAFLNQSPRIRSRSNKFSARSPPRRKDEKRKEGGEEDCVRRLEVCADGGGVDIYNASAFCTGDMTDYFPVNWSLE